MNKGQGAAYRGPVRESASKSTNLFTGPRRLEGKTALLCRGVFLFVSGREVPSAADSPRANRSFLSPRDIAHRNARKAAFHRENVISNRKRQCHIGRGNSHVLSALCRVGRFVRAAVP